MTISEKISLKDREMDNNYLPPISDVYQYLGTKFDIITTLELSEAKGMEVPKISRSSKHALRSKGVGPKIFLNILDWLPSNIDTTSLKGRIEGTLLARSLKAESNAARYLAAIDNLSLDKDINAFTPLIKFIEQRCRTDIEFAEETRNKIEAGKLDPTNNLSYFWQEHDKPFWLANTTLSLSVLNSLDNKMTDNEPNLTDKQRIEIFHADIRKRFDFHLSFIANYEVCCALASCPNKQSLQTLAPLACHAIKQYATSDENRTCFNWALQTLKDWWSKTEPHVGWRKIASYIPVEDIEPEIESPSSHIDKQYSRLKDWRRGQNLPSNELLARFITNVSESMGSNSEGDSLFILCRITIGLDKTLTNLVKEWGKEIGSENQISTIWKDVLSHYYDDYYLHYLNQHIAKIEKRRN